MKSVEMELSEKIEIQSMKQKYEEMSVTLQNILDPIGNVEHSKAANHESRIRTRSQELPEMEETR